MIVRQENRLLPAVVEKLFNNIANISQIIICFLQRWLLLKYNYYKQKLEEKSLGMGGRKFLF